MSKLMLLLLFIGAIWESWQKEKKKKKVAQEYLYGCWDGIGIHSYRDALSLWG